MQEEVENRTVNLAISTTKLTWRALVSGFKKFMASQEKRSARIEARASKQANAHPTGKQTVKELIGQNQGVSSIDISSTDIRGFEKYARKFGVDYAICKDKSTDPPKYLVFFKARDADALTAAMSSYTAEVMNKDKRPSALEQLAKLKTLVKSLPGKMKEKIHTEPSR